METLYRANLLSITIIWEGFSSGFQAYIPREIFKNKIQDFNKITRTIASFKKHFFQWCDGFFAFKFANYASSNLYPKVDISEAATGLGKGRQGIEPESMNVRILLEKYRKLDRRQLQ